jgi:hypothetical protein
MVVQKVHFNLFGLTKTVNWNQQQALLDVGREDGDILLPIAVGPGLVATDHGLGGVVPAGF